MATVFIITLEDGTPHQVVKTEKQAIKYCVANPDYDWECYQVNDN